MGSAQKTPAAKGSAQKRPAQKRPASKAAVAKTVASTAVPGARPSRPSPGLRSRGPAAAPAAGPGHSVWRPACWPWRVVASRSGSSWSGGSSPSDCTPNATTPTTSRSSRSAPAGPMVITPDGVRLHTEVDELPADGGTSPAGPEDDLTLVLVHGYALSLDCWHFQRQALPRTGSGSCCTTSARTVAPAGRRGSCAGCRSWPRTCCRSSTRWSGDGPVVLAGHSMGGMTIMHLALDPPRAVRHPDPRRRPLLHRGRGDGRPLTDPRAAGADLRSHRPADHGRPQPDPRGRRTWPDRRIRPQLRLHQEGFLRFRRPAELRRVHEPDARTDPDVGDQRLLPGVRRAGRVRGLQRAGHGRDGRDRWRGRRDHPDQAHRQDHRAAARARMSAGCRIAVTWGSSSTTRSSTRC